MSLFQELGKSLKPEPFNMSKASIVVMSHLSDAGTLNLQDKAIEANIRINFAKYIILHCGGDLTQVIDPDLLWNEYNKTKITDFTKLNY